jgi:hypothetical protein
MSLFTVMPFYIYTIALTSLSNITGKRLLFTHINGSMKTLSLLMCSWLAAWSIVTAVSAQQQTTAMAAASHVVGLQLVIADWTDLTNSTMLHLNDTTPSLTVLAVVSSSSVPINGVRFRWNSATIVRVDRTATYTLYGGTFARCSSLTACTHTITATFVFTLVAEPMQMRRYVLDFGKVHDNIIGSGRNRNAVGAAPYRSLR